VAKERKVVYSLEVVEGAGNKQAFDNTEAGIRAATAALKENTAAKKENDRVNSASPNRKGSGSRADAFSRGMDKAEINAAKQLAADEKREREYNIRESQRAGQQAEREAKKRIAENQKIYSGYVQIAGGVTQAARAAILLGASSEDSAKQMLKMVLVGEGIVSTFSAVKNIGQGLSKAFGAGGVHPFAIAGLAGGAAAAGIGASLTSSYAAQAVKDNRPLVNGKYVNDSFLAATDGIGLTSVADDIRAARKKEEERKERLQMAAARRAEISESEYRSRQDLQREYTRASGSSAFARRFNANWQEDMPNGSFDPIIGSQREHRAAMGDIGARRAGAAEAFDYQRRVVNDTTWRYETTMGDAAASPQEQAVALKAMQDALEEQKRLHIEIAEIDRDANRENLRASDERLSKLKNERGERLAMLREAQGERRSGAAIFNEMNRAEQAALVSGVKKKDTGDLLSITDFEAKQMEKIRGSTAASAAEERAVTLGMNKGFRDLVPSLYRSESQLAKNVTEVTAKIQNELILKVNFEANERDMAAGFLKAIQPYRDRLTDLFGKVAEMAGHQLKADDARKIREVGEQ